MNKEELRRRFAGYSRHGKKFEKALETVASGGVKGHRFVPSGRVIYTVVGHLGDEFVDPDRHYCSCSNYYFRVLTGREDTCYHLLSYEMAAEAKAVEIADFGDEEYDAMLSVITRDVFDVIDRSAGG